MKTKTKITVDRLVGLPIAWLLNGLARILGRLLRRDHSIGTGNVRTIVISKYLGMGSILQATPLIRSIRAAFPEARLIFVTGHSCRQMVERLEHIDAIITVDDRGFFQVARTSLRTIAMLIRAQVDLYFDLEFYSAYSSIMSLLSLCPEPDRILSRVGTAQAGQLYPPDVLQHAGTRSVTSICNSAGWSAVARSSPTGWAGSGSTPKIVTRSPASWRRWVAGLHATSWLIRTHQTCWSSGAGQPSGSPS